jgi:hypothetical protein
LTQEEKLNHDKASKRKYAESRKGKEYEMTAKRAASYCVYNNSPEGRAARAEYADSAEGRASGISYEQSTKGKLTRAANEKSEKRN